MERPRSFGRFFALLLAERELPAAAFARLVGCSKGWPANIASGSQRPPKAKAQLDAWARALKLNAGEAEAFLELAGLAHSPDWFVEWYWKQQPRSGR